MFNKKLFVQMNSIYNFNIFIKAKLYMKRKSDQISKQLKKSNICVHEDCKTRASFNYEGQTKALYCAQHKLESMVDIKSKRCQHMGCTMRPIFNYEGQSIALYCSLHKLESMVDIKHKRCQHTGCTTRPNFNYEGQSIALYCSLHKLESMVDIMNKRCQYLGCTTIATFNHKGQTKALYCARHKLESMVDIKSKRCQHTGCMTNPSFNYEGQTRALYCVRHKLEFMVNVKSRCCRFVGCTKQPTFNYEGQAIALYCGLHKLISMVNIIAKRCEFAACTSQPWYGIPGKKAIHCALHKVAGEISCPTRKCQIENCKQKALYGINSAPTHCEQHHEPEHTNLVQKECVICNVLEIVDDEQKCSRCSEYLNKRLHLRKQRQVKSWFDCDENLRHYDFYDRPVETQCGRERPDFAWDCRTHFVVLEVDEYQHQNYQCECEQTRMVNVTNQIGMPCFWIRYNPDEYKGCTLKITERLRKETLLKFIKICINSNPTTQCEFLRVAYLFFDGFKLGDPIEISNMPVL